jgi:biopolymer transport protein ExbB
MNELVTQFTMIWEEALVIWRSGGWAMIAIAIIALVMFGLGVHVYLKLTGKGFASVREKTWRRWIDHPAERRGPIGELLDLATGARSIKEASEFFEEVRAAEVAPFERDLRVMKICVSGAPLLGLLGTVTGMLATFAALATGSGGDETMGLVAGGISEALVTTETGLVIALAGLFFQYQLARKLERYKAFLAHLETVCTQKLYRDLARRKATAPAPVPEPLRELEPVPEFVGVREEADQTEEVELTASAA